jgi:hypothetical protein
MSSSSADWEALTSQNERLIHAADTALRSADDGPVSPGSARWAELASQRERLVAVSDPLYGLTGSAERRAGLRLAAPAA